jgi:hypothetical protein
MAELDPRPARRTPAAARILRSGRIWPAPRAAGGGGVEAFAELRAGTYYQLLGVDPQAEAFIIDAAWRAQIRRRHPDSGGDTLSAQLINRAYRVLRDPASRARYDAALHAACAATAAADHEPVVHDQDLSRPPAHGLLAAALYLSLGLLLLASAAASLRAPSQRILHGAIAALPDALQLSRDIPPAVASMNCNSPQCSRPKR